MATAAPALRTRGVSKSYGAHAVLRDVSLELRGGEVHVLAGENGAGKSTLIRALSGALEDFGGAIELDGRPVRFRSPSEARRAGIATIWQELSLVPTMSVEDNLFLARERRGQRARGRQALEAVGLAVELDAAVETLPLAQQQLVEIAKALLDDARVVVMDEPTSALSEREVTALLARVSALREQGRAVLYITHKMEEIYRVADRISVLRDGVLVGTSTPAELPSGLLVEWMLGRALAGAEVSRRDATLAASAEVALHVAAPGRAFDVHRGEIVALAGLQGSGCSELLHEVFGEPRRSIARGVVLLPNDRKAQGLVLDLDVVDNAVLTAGTSPASPAAVRGPFLRRAAERAEVSRVVEELRLAAPSLETEVRALSGGNQQKVLLARCLLAKPRVLLLDEPTRGVDVGAKADIHAMLRRLADQGLAVLMASTEMEEVLSLGDRVVVMHRGAVTAVFARDEATREGVLRAAMGVAEAGAA